MSAGSRKARLYVSPISVYADDFEWNRNQESRAQDPTSCTISRMHDVAARLLMTIRKRDFLRAGDRVAMAVSGGADSVALLLLLEELRAELGIVLSVVHVNHKLRGAESDEDERFVIELAARLGLECDVVIAPADSSTGEADSQRPKPNVEALARELRYNFFRELGERGRANKIVTAHTLDDQAETVLLRMFRGTGIRGLAGILPRFPASGDTGDGGRGFLARARKNLAGEFIDAEIIRPLLAFRRAELRNYLRARGESWHEDSSNKDPSFTRNRARLRLLPLIAEDFGDAAIEHIAELAEIARAEEDYCAIAAQLTAAEAAESSIDAGNLLAQPLALQRRFIRAWLQTNAPGASISFALVEEILQLAGGEAGQKLELPGEVSRNVRRGRDEIMIEAVSSSGAEQYEYTLPVPGTVDVCEIGARFVSRIVETASAPEGGAFALLDPEEVGESLTIRNWRPGDRYWPAHTAREKKVKELLADLHATGAKKKLWPVAVDARQRIVWLRGFAAPEAARAHGAKAVLVCDESPSA